MKKQRPLSVALEAIAAGASNVCGAYVLAAALAYVTGWEFTNALGAVFAACTLFVVLIAGTVFVRRIAEWDCFDPIDELGWLWVPLMVPTVGHGVVRIPFARWRFVVWRISR